MVQIHSFRAFRPLSSSELNSEDSSKPINSSNSLPNRFNKTYDRSVIERDICLGVENNCKCFNCSEAPVVVISPEQPITKDHRMNLRNFSEFVDGGMIEELGGGGIIVYEQIVGDHRQVGVCVALDVENFLNGTIKKHECTTRNHSHNSPHSHHHHHRSRSSSPSSSSTLFSCGEGVSEFKEKEKIKEKEIEKSSPHHHHHHHHHHSHHKRKPKPFNQDPVLLMYPDEPAVHTAVQSVLATPPTYSYSPSPSSSHSSSSSSSLHNIWFIPTPPSFSPPSSTPPSSTPSSPSSSLYQSLSSSFLSVSSLYIADGHHRVEFATSLHLQQQQINNNNNNNNNNHINYHSSSSSLLNSSSSSSLSKQKKQQQKKISKKQNKKQQQQQQQPSFSSLSSSLHHIPPSHHHHHHQYLISFLFPSSHLRILPFHRCLKNLNCWGEREKEREEKAKETERKESGEGEREEVKEMKEESEIQKKLNYLMFEIENGEREEKGEEENEKIKGESDHDEGEVERKERDRREGEIREEGERRERNIRGFMRELTKHFSFSLISRPPPLSSSLSSICLLLSTGQWYSLHPLPTPFLHPLPTPSPSTPPPPPCPLLSLDCSLLLSRLFLPTLGEEGVHTTVLYIPALPDEKEKPSSSSSSPSSSSSSSSPFHNNNNNNHHNNNNSQGTEIEIDRDIDIGVLLLEHSVLSHESEVAFYLRGVQVEEVMNIADRGLLLPPKATYFHPKPLSGLLTRLN